MIGGADSDLNATILLQTKKKAKRDNFKKIIKLAQTLTVRRYTYEGDDTVEYARLKNDTAQQYDVDEIGTNAEERDYYIPADGWYRIGGRLAWATGYSAANFLLMNQDVPLYSGIGGSERIIKTQQDDLSDVLWLYGPAPFQYTGIKKHWYYPFDEGNVDLDEVIYLKKGCYGFWIIAPGSATTLPYPGDVGSYEVDIDLTITRRDNDSIEITDEQICWLDYNFMFGALTAADVFKEILKAFGQYAEWDVADNELKIFGFSDIVAAKATAYDWSDKVLDKAKSLKYNLDLPVQLLIRWAEEEQYNGLKDLFAPILSNQDGASDYAVNSLFSACNGLITETAAGELTYPLLITNHVGRDNDLSIRKLAAYDSHVKLATVVQRLPKGPTKGIHFLYNQGGGATIMEDHFNVDQSIFHEMSDAFFDYNDDVNGIGKYFKDLLAALYKIAYIEVPVYLQPKDIATLQMRKPVYLRQYGAYFSIEKVKYVQGGTSTVELLRINS